MNRSPFIRRWSWVLGIPLCAVGAAQGQLADGNFDALAVGTPPDCTTPAGAWQFPANYQAGAACEVLPTEFTIVPTNSFDPTHTGNSLSLLSPDAVDNEHLTNILTTPIMPAAGQIVRVEFDIWVNAVGDGGSFYAGADNGGGGFTNTTDRGPQISWWDDGTLKRWDNAGIGTVVVQSYPRGQWQHVRLDIHFDLANYDFYYAPLSGQALMTLGTALPFRATTPPTFLERITVVHFGGTVGLQNSSSFYDNFTATLVSNSSCYANCDGSTSIPFLNVNDFICFQSQFAAGASYANCDHSTTPPVLNVNDFICFQTQFAAGCSAP